jgi:hypothetical protein
VILLPEEEDGTYSPELVSEPDEDVDRQDGNDTEMMMITNNQNREAEKVRSGKGETINGRRIEKRNMLRAILLKDAIGKSVKNQGLTPSSH